MGEPRLVDVESTTLLVASGGRSSAAAQFTVDVSKTGCQLMLQLVDNNKVNCPPTQCSSSSSSSSKQASAQQQRLWAKLAAAAAEEQQKQQQSQYLGCGSSANALSPRDSNSAGGRKLALCVVLNQH